MNIALASLDGFYFLLRWFHYIFGVIWIGHLYYFNFVQTPFFGETDGTTKSNVIQKLVPRALWWFRWGAMFTFITGLMMLLMKGHQAGGMEVYATSWGVNILIGATFGFIMFLNVWMIIWPCQKVVIASAEAAAKGQPANPDAAARGARAAVASRTNVLLSFPMLFFMGAASHLPVQITPESHLCVLAGITAVIVAAIEFNAIKGKLGPLATVKGVVHCSLALAVIMYAIVEAIA